MLPPPSIGKSCSEPPKYIAYSRARGSPIPVPPPRSRQLLYIHTSASWLRAMPPASSDTLMTTWWAGDRDADVDADVDVGGVYMHMQCTSSIRT